MSQDDFTAVSSRTYVSSIERGLKSPTIEKLSQLALAMNTNSAVIVVIASVLEIKDVAFLEKMIHEARGILDLEGDR